VNELLSEGGGGLTGKSKIEIDLWLIIARRITGPRVSTPSRFETALNLLAPRPSQSPRLIRICETRGAIIPRIPCAQREVYDPTFIRVVYDS
jgi:hypothetical protein